MAGDGLLGAKEGLVGGAVSLVNRGEDALGEVGEGAGELLADGLAVGSEALGGVRRGGGAEVGGEVGEGFVYFVADAGDNGRRLAAMARTRRSSLKTARSSALPPPRMMTMASRSERWLSKLRAAMIWSAALSPWT